MSSCLHRHFTFDISLKAYVCICMEETMNEIYRIFMGIFAPKMAVGMNKKVMILTIQLAPLAFLTAHRRCTIFSIRGLAIKLQLSSFEKSFPYVKNSPGNRFFTVTKYQTDLYARLYLFRRKTVWYTMIMMMMMMIKQKITNSLFTGYRR